MAVLPGASRLELWACPHSPQPGAWGCQCSQLVSEWLAFGRAQKDLLSLPLTESHSAGKIIIRKSFCLAAGWGARGACLKERLHSIWTAGHAPLRPQGAGGSVVDQQAGGRSGSLGRPRLSSRHQGAGPGQVTRDAVLNETDHLFSGNAGSGWPLSSFGQTPESSWFSSGFNRVK